MQSRYEINHFNNWERIGELQNTVLERIRFGEAFCKTDGKQLSNVIIRRNETRGKTSEPFHLHNYPETIFTRKAFPFCYMWLLLNFTVAFFYYLFLFVCRSELWRQSVFFVSGFFSFPILSLNSRAFWCTRAHALNFSGKLFLIAEQWMLNAHNSHRHNHNFTNMK